MKVLELYSGIGGMHYALKASCLQNEWEVVCAVDLNPYCNDVYKYNFINIPVLNKNISSLTLEDIKQLSPDMILLSPPCQPFTRIGKQKDINDERINSFLILLSLLPELPSVSYLLLENVKGFEVSETRLRLFDVLRSCGFICKEFLLNSSDFGICNSRLRYYLLAKRSIPTPINLIQDQIIVNIPEEFLPIIKHLQMNSSLPKIVFEILEHKPFSKEWSNYLVPQKYLKKYINVIDIISCENNNSCCFTRGYTRYFEGTGSVISEKSRDEVESLRLLLKKTSVNNWNDECNLILEKLKLRFFTPKEITRLMLFPEHFQFPKHITLQQQYKMIANSVNVFVVAVLISYLINNF